MLVISKSNKNEYMGNLSINGKHTQFACECLNISTIITWLMLVTHQWARMFWLPITVSDTILPNGAELNKSEWLSVFLEFWSTDFGSCLSPLNTAQRFRLIFQLHWLQSTILFITMSLEKTRSSADWWNGQEWWWWHRVDWWRWTRCKEGQYCQCNVGAVPMQAC